MHSLFPFSQSNAPMPLVTNADGCYLLDVPAAAADTPTHLKVLETCQQVVDFVSIFYDENSIIPEEITAEGLREDGGVMFRGVRFDGHMALSLIPESYLEEVYVTFPKHFPAHTFLKYTPGTVLPAIETPKGPEMVEFPLVVGNLSNKVAVDSHGKMYQWKLYVRSPLPQEIFAKSIAKVVFDIHESFADSNRAVESPGPFEVSESGWGEFTAGVIVHFSHGGVFRTSHQIKLFRRDDEPENEAQPIERHERYKFVQIPAEMLSSELLAAIAEYRANYDPTAENAQIARLEAVCEGLRADIKQNAERLVELQQQALREGAAFHPKYA